MKLDLMPRNLLVEKCEDWRKTALMNITKPKVGLNWHRTEFRGELWS
jgi:hypothetical protein